MRYLLNSAVITRPGTYTYRLATPEEAADRIHTLSGIKPGLNRKTTAMQPGDEALVVRLKYRMRIGNMGYSGWNNLPEATSPKV